jgi:uncharacterized protein (UPF0303 family)
VTEPATTGGFTSEGLAEQAAALGLRGFDAADALTLGRLATDRALQAGLPIVIEVWRLGRLAYRAVLPGGPVDSDTWIARKRRVVERYERSTLAVRVHYEERGTTFWAATGESELEYAAHGGGYPIVVDGVGIVGGIYASGLPQVDDHEFLVACLRAFKGD